MRFRKTALFSCALYLLVSCAAEPQRTVNVAVAANFTEPAKEIAQLFQQKTGHQALPSFGSSGKLLTQIMQEAPFEVFLSADEESPRKAIAAGFGVNESLFTYAVGRLVLYSANLDLSNGEAIL